MTTDDGRFQTSTTVNLFNFSLNFFFLLLVEHDNVPKLEIDRKKMQYRRYEKIYPNSTCKQHCDPTKGWVPLLKVNMPFLFVSYVIVFVNA
jgi:hypothetical protein